MSNARMLGALRTASTAADAALDEGLRWSDTFRQAA
jgi:hypothetical protein